MQLDSLKLVKRLGCEIVSNAVRTSDDRHVLDEQELSINSVASQLSSRLATLKNLKFVNSLGSSAPLRTRLAFLRRCRLDVNNAARAQNPAIWNHQAIICRRAYSAQSA